jgi:alcohol dehydrogenase class IV
LTAALFRAPERFLFGVGAIESLGDEALRFGRRALLVTGRRAMAEAGITDRCLAILRKAGIEADLFDEVDPEPDVAAVDRCRDTIRRERADVVIGLGGGSAMDVAKVAAGLAHEEEPTCAFHTGRTPASRGLAMIAVPTTAGTGSEMTNNGVLSDRARGFKASIRDDSFVPAVALVDPELSVPCPPFVTAASGVDALVQAIESYLSRHATPMTEALSLRAVEELAAALPGVVHRGDDLALRTRAAWGSAMAGLALSNARLGVIHGMAHPIGVRFAVPHGLVCGVLLPAALEFVRPAAPEKFARLASLLGGDPAAYARDLLSSCDLPARLTEYGLRADAFDAIADESLASGSTKATPRPVTKEDILALVRAIA